MHEPVTTLEPGDADQPGREPPPFEPPQGRAMKFAYASGARPLEGYTIKRGVGIGGFGEVYFATSDAGKEVALKRIQRHLDVELRGVKQCLNLKHAHLVALFDIKYDDQGEAWVVMEYVSGESLKDVLDRHPSGMTTDAVHVWFQGMAAGVGYLHDHGIVHRDLKPGNVFLDDDVVKIGDYGLSKFISCSRRSGQTESVGTFHYMAPEIGKGVYGKEIDIYALGIILFEMLTGRVPFDGESSQEIMMKHLTSDPELGGIDEPYRRVIRKALAKDPDARYRSVNDLLADLRLDGTPVASTSAMSASPSSASESARGAAAPVIGTESKPRPLYIDEHTEPGIVLGDVREVVVAQPVAEPPYAVRPRRVAVPPQPAMQHSRPRSMSQTVASIGRRRRRPTKELLREHLKSRPQSDRLAELTGSLMMAAVVAAVVCLASLAIGGSAFASGIQWWQFYAWMTLTSTAGAWLILGLGKLWETDEGDQFRRRFVLLLAGLALGVYAYASSDWLLRVQWPNRGVEFFENLYAGGAPRLPAFLCYLASLFVVLRWWRQADPARPWRFGMFDTLVCALWAWLLALVWQFSWWGVAVAVAISLAVQLAAPWITTQQRHEIRDRCQQD